MGEAIVFIINSNFAFRDGNPSATADGTDCFQARFWTFEGKALATKRISHKKAQKAQKEEKRETQLRSILNCVSASVVDFSFVLFVPFCG
jgi:hypothetical protein